MIGTRATTGGADGATKASSSAVVGDFNERFRKRRGGVVGNGGGVGGASPAAAMRRPTTKIAIPPRMYGVSDTGA
jgi:hypothetical protein